MAMTPGDVLFTLEGRSSALAEVSQRVDVLARNLRAAGVGRGTRVGLLIATGWVIATGWALSRRSTSRSGS